MVGSVRTRALWSISLSPAGLWGSCLCTKIPGNSGKDTILLGWMKLLALLCVSDVLRQAQAASARPAAAWLLHGGC